MEWIDQLSDDQIALIGCFAAIVLSGGLMALGNSVGQSRRQNRSENSLPRNTIEIIEPATLTLNEESDKETRKKAA